MRRFRVELKDGEASGIAFGDPVRPIDVLFLHATGFNAITYQSILEPLGALVLPVYGAPVATRKAYGEALAAVAAADPQVVVLDAEVSNSTHAEDAKKTAPERFFEMYIAEQQLVAAAVGMQVLGLRPYASTFRS